jgi:hypothetical protein
MTHEWLAITAPNGEQGYQCQRCRLTAIHLPVRSSCPPKLIPTLAELLDEVRRKQAAAATASSNTPTATG